MASAEPKHSQKNRNGLGDKPHKSSRHGYNQDVRMSARLLFKIKSVVAAVAQELHNGNIYVVGGHTLELEPRILVVDDEERIRRLVRMYMERAGFQVDEADDGLKAVQMAKSERYALLILDLMLPGLDGRDACSQIRQFSSVPIIMLTAAGEESNRIQGFELGADDYVIKPFSPRELVMRVKALLKRVGEQDFDKHEFQQMMSFPELTIHMEARKVEVGGVEIGLTPKEFDLLVYLAQRPEKVFSREDLLRDVWNYQFYGDQRTVDTHVKRLREKLGQVSERVNHYIVTVWGVGYKFEISQ